MTVPIAQNQSPKAAAGAGCAGKVSSTALKAKIVSPKAALVVNHETADQRLTPNSARVKIVAATSSAPTHPGT